MKVYLASSFALIPLVKEVAKYLENRGHEITVKWWSREYEIPGELAPVPTTVLKLRNNDLDPKAFYCKPETERSYNADFKGIKDADALVIISGHVPSYFTGANIELGIALALGKTCYALGALRNSAIYYPVIRCKNIRQLTDELGDDIE